MNLLLPASTDMMAGCIAAVILFAFACAAILGASFRTWIEDMLMVLLTEGTINMAFRSPLDWMHLHGRPLTDWGFMAGTGLAVVGILLNHLAGRSSASRNKRRAG